MVLETSNYFIYRYKSELLDTKQSLKETLIQLSQSQMASTTTTPVNIAKEHDSKISFNESHLNMRKEPLYKFNKDESQSM